MRRKKFVDLIQTNNLAKLRFFRISHIIVEKLNFRFSIVFFEIKRKYTSYEKILRIKFVNIFIVNNFVL